MRFEFTNPTVHVDGYDLSQDVVRVSLEYVDASPLIDEVRWEQATARLPRGTLQFTGSWDDPPDTPPPGEDVLVAIDAATGGLCACGCQRPLDPNGASAYFFNADCQRLWNEARAVRPYEVHGSQWVDSDQMRWRPDLVSEAPDEGLELRGRPFRRGRFTAQMFTRTDRHGIHLRLDDGNRFVGVDVTTEFAEDPNALEEAWGRLERELGDQRRLIPSADRPHRQAATWDEVHVWPAVVADQLRAGLLTPLQAATLCQPDRPTAGRVTHFTTVRDIQAHLDRARTSVAAINEEVRAAVEAISRACCVPESMLHEAHANEDHPMLQAIEARRQRQNSGPPERRRAPRRIDPPRR